MSYLDFQDSLPKLQLSYVNDVMEGRQKFQFYELGEHHLINLTKISHFTCQKANELGKKNELVKQITHREEAQRLQVKVI
jgi:hypothetical protein